MRLSLAAGLCALALLGCGLGVRDPAAQYDRAQAAVARGDYPEAARWFRRAARQGHADAQFALGTLYEVGAGVPQDYEAMVKWMTAAAEQGHPHAEFALGLLYSRAVMWGPNWKEIRKSRVRRAYWGLRWSLGWRPPGVRADGVQAYMWLTRAAAHGHPNARNHLLILDGRLTPNQIADARRRATDRLKPGP